MKFLLVAFNKADIYTENKKITGQLKDTRVNYVSTSATTGTGIPELRELILKTAPVDFIERPGILSDLVSPDELAILVIPIDSAAPKGRLILPQVQSIRDLLDNDSMCLIVKENGLKNALSKLNKPPKLIVTDSQVFAKVAADTPKEIPLTSFSILFARFRRFNRNGAWHLNHRQAKAGR